jgi:hypothetical protein
MPGIDEPLDKYVARFMVDKVAIAWYPIAGRRRAVAHWKWYGRR